MSTQSVVKRRRRRWLLHILAWLAFASSGTTALVAAAQPAPPVAPQRVDLPWDWTAEGVADVPPGPSGAAPAPTTQPTKGATVNPTQTPHANTSDTPPGRTAASPEPTDSPSAPAPPRRLPDCYASIGGVSYYWPMPASGQCGSPPPDARHQP